MKQTFTKLGGALFALLFLATSSASATITAKWDWKNQIPASITEANSEGAGAAFIEPSNVDGVMLSVSGIESTTYVKMAYNSSGYAQVNVGTQIHVPVVSTEDVVTVDIAANPAYTYVGGEQATGVQVIHKPTSDEVSQGYVVVEAKNGTSYPSCITVDLAYSLPIKTVYWDWKNNYPSGIRTVNIQKTSEEYIPSNDPNVSLIFVSGKLSNNGNSETDYSQFTEGSIVRVPVTSTSDIITVSFHPSGFNSNGKYKIGGTSQSSNPAIYNATSSDVANGYVEIISGGSYIYSIALDKGNPFTTATIGSTGWATFSNASATDFTGLTGVVDAYQVTGNSGSAITKNAVTTAAGNTGLLLNGDAGTYAIPVVASGTDLSSSNKLVAVATSTAVTAAAGDFTNFVLVGGSGTASFKKITGANSATVGAGKAYLQLAGSSFAPQLFFDADVTGIGAVKSINKEDGAYYNLAGQRVAQPQKGLYIVNGKKVIIK